MTTREKVDELEESAAVESLNVKFKGKSFQIYPWLKGRLFHKMITGQETLQKRDFKLYWQQLTSVFYGLHNIFGSYKIWAFTSSAERRKIDGKYVDKLFDYLGNETGYKALIIELRLFNYYPYKKIASKRAISKSFFILFETIYAKLFVRKPLVNNPQLLEEICSQVPDGINSTEIIRKYLSQYQMMRFWLKILPNPKLVMMSVGYTNFGYIRAFKEKGIKVVEMQHGIITKNHHAYYYHKDFNSIQFPDILLTVGEKELEVFDDENKFPVSNVISVGSFIIDSYSNKKVERDSNQLPLVLFTLQDGVMGAKLIDFILVLKKLAGNDIEILVQPRRNGKEFYAAQTPEVQSLNFSSTDFYSAVINTDIHSTVYSTTAIESLSLGVPNILVNIDNQSKEQLGDALAGNNYTVIVETAEEFMEAFQSLKSIRPAEVMTTNNRNIKSNYRVNIKEFLNEIMKG